MSDLARPLATFLSEHLPRDRGASPHTIASYAATFRLLVVFAAHRHVVRPCQLQVGQLDTATLLAFLEHLENDRDNSVRTRNARLAAIKSFFRYLEFRHPEHLDLAAQVHALPKKKADLAALEYLNHTEVEALLDAPAADTVTGLRDRAMLCLAYNAGLRVSELVGLALEDLRAPALDSIRIMGKGRRGRVLPLWKQTRATLRNWLAVRPDSSDGHLFLNASGVGMTRRGFAKRLAQHATTATRTAPSMATKNVTPHALRHACALHTRGDWRYPAGRPLAWPCQPSVNRNVPARRPGEQARDPRSPAAPEPSQGLLRRRGGRTPCHARRHRSAIALWEPDELRIPCYATARRAQVPITVRFRYYLLSERSDNKYK